MSTRLLTFKEAIREAQEQALANDRSVFVIGEGVPDPKACFGTTAGLKEKFPNQVFDMPISENGLTGVCIGAAINGLKPILVHQRIDFSLYSMDQLVNNAAKWYSMFGGQSSVPMVVRMIVGRGWGQGNQHSQNLTSMFAHIPGLKVVCPSNAWVAKGLLLQAIKDPNPVIFIEHRWLYDTTSDVPASYWSSINDAHVLPGEDITVVASGHAYREVFQAREWLAEDEGIHFELIDLRVIKPIPYYVIHESAKKTGKLLVVDDCWKTCGLAGEIIAEVVCRNPDVRCQRITYPDYPSASSPYLARYYYNNAGRIANAILSILERKGHCYRSRGPAHDVPNADFKGPF
jgi:acetoin:2,6-dichlorophenolindophenol oxidoreductase subunit beta